jgi:arylformamidase
MTIYDISLTVTPGMVTWENTERGLSLEWAAQIGADSACNVSVISGGMHTGTHVDAPLHFVDGGGTIAHLDLDTLVGPATVVEIYGQSPLTADVLEAANLPLDKSRLVLKTDNTRRGLLHQSQFYTDYCAVAPSGAEWLVSQGVRLVGIDYLSIGPYGESNVETHRILLGAGVVIVEGLLLDAVTAGDYSLAALPPKVQGAEGSPCRAILWT